MMLFGDKYEFGIEAEITEYVNGAPLGKFRFWLENRSIGNFLIETLLGTYSHYLKYFLKEVGLRKSLEFENKAPEEILFFLKRALYSDFGQTVEECANLEKNYRKFILSPGIGEALDEYFLIIIETYDEIRVICEKIGIDNIGEFFIELNSFLYVVELFIKWVEKNTAQI